MWWGDQALPLTPRWAYLYGLLALRVLEGGAREVLVADMARLPGWIGVQERRVGGSLARHGRDMRARGFALLTSPHGQRTRQVALDPAAVQQVEVDVNPEGLRSWLGLAHTVTPRPDVIEVSRLLTLAETTFEQGRHDEAEALAAQAAQAQATMDQQLRALALIAWVKTINAPHDQGWASVRALQAKLSEFQRGASVMDRPSLSAEALVWIQTARFHMRKHQAKQARTAYQQAARLLSPEHHREWGAIEAGLGYLAQLDDRLDEAERLYRTSLDHFSKARWPWAMHVQYNNLAAVCFSIHTQLLEKRPGSAAHWLDQAVRWSRDALEFAEQMDFGGAVDLEVNLAYAMRLQGRWDEAANWLRRAQNIASASGSTTDLACVHAERAELEEALGQREAATASMRQAVALLRQVGAEDWTAAAQDRLDQLEGRRALGPSIKLW